MACEAYKRRPAYSVTIRISANLLLLKGFITEVLEYKAEELNLYAFAMCSLVMSLYSRDVIKILLQ